MNALWATVKPSVNEVCTAGAEVSTNRIAIARSQVAVIATMAVLLTIAGCGQKNAAAAIVIEKHMEPAAWIFVPMEISCGKNCTTTEPVPMYYPDSYEVKVSAKDGAGRAHNQVYWVSRKEFEEAMVGRPLDCAQNGTCKDTRAPAARASHATHDVPAAGN